MSLLEILNDTISALGIPVETGAFSDTPPATYVVLTPLAETYEAFGDNKPMDEVEEIRVSLFNFGNYVEIKNKICRAIIDADLTITARLYIGFDQETGYHNYAIDVAKENSLIKEENE